MKLLVFDNYDSFTYNLVHQIENISGVRPDVFKNDQVTMQQISEYDKIVLSPGPGLPSTSGLMMELIQEFAATKSILGVCLGHQAIAESFGATLVNLSNVFHGVAHALHVVEKDCPLFAGVSADAGIGLYHSWVVSKQDFPECLKVTAEDENGFIMAIQHEKYDLQGVQFHPESILTPQGEKIMSNWLRS